MNHLLSFIGVLLFIALPTASTPHFVGHNLHSKIKTIVIDAGHGGKDNGASGRAQREKNITLKIALLLGGYIQKNIPNVKVVYTRQSDIFLELHERADIAAYEAEIERLLMGVTADNHGLALAIARLPMDVRGFGPVKDKARADVAARRTALWAKWPGEAARAAA